MIINTLLTIFGIFVLFQVAIRILKKLFRLPAPAFIGRLLDSNFRRKFQSPAEVIRRSGIKEGLRVLDLGCGSGAYTTFLAKAVGEKGRVYAVDIQPAMLKQLEKKLSRPESKNIKNVETRIASADALPFADNSLDLVLLIAVLQETPDRRRALQEIKRVLRPGGVCAVTELLPDPDYPLKSTTIKLGREAGFILDEVLGNFWKYTVRFKKP